VGLSLEPEEHPIAAVTVNARIRARRFSFIGASSL
jgi:hypothetical protein